MARSKKENRVIGWFEVRGSRFGFEVLGTSEGRKSKVREGRVIQNEPGRRYTKILEGPEGTRRYSKVPKVPEGA